ncbi:maintenance of telomere capping protein 1 [Talaromyces proteolyticus]|uniref:Maintenance of telomere capping protein 1 n=1 Tax=Talaromyces proteolyticus TaxID=1131652 RepID=A0AAD4KUU1_9EURO|nr:maintenance of telomere capping protein 1 [Talaromyces proteolyticus]KAH8700404.1 maintenance of telomere capping protein 1 [Talaromyces proteolyticus]
MPPKSAKPTSDELLAQFDDLGIDTNKNTDNNNSNKQANVTDAQKDPLAELETLASQRPTTPRVSTEARRSKPSSGRTSEDRPAVNRKSEDASAPHPATVEEEGQQNTSSAATNNPPAAQEAPRGTAAGGGGGWWGGILSTATATASAAMKHAEAAVKEIQNNEEAQKWAEQVKGNVGALRDFGGELRTLALPTFTSLIHTLAPPISSHERLQIHITHDLSGYPSFDPLIYEVFARVMAQVEGGDLLVIQRGQESSPRRGSEFGFQVSTAGWHDGPWWRTVTPGNPRNISAVKGTVEGTKLVRASAESYATEYYSSRGGVEEAAKQATAVLSDSNPVRSSDIFLAIQAISQAKPKELFQAGATAEKSPAGGVVELAEEADEEVLFAVYLHDPVHGIAFHAISQAIPQKWVDWLDASVPAVEPKDNEGNADHNNIPRVVVPDAIAEIVESGGVDPREWVADWIEESLSLAVGVVAQRYVARRMGVGEGGIAKGKLRAEQTTTVESGAGEAARAL